MCGGGGDLQESEGVYRFGNFSNAMHIFIIAPRVYSSTTRACIPEVVTRSANQAPPGLDQSRLASSPRVRSKEEVTPCTLLSGAFLQSIPLCSIEEEEREHCGILGKATTWPATAATCVYLFPPGNSYLICSDRGPNDNKRLSLSHRACMSLLRAIQWEVVDSLSISKSFMPTQKIGRLIWPRTITATIATATTCDRPLLPIIQLPKGDIWRTNQSVGVDVGAHFQWWRKLVKFSQPKCPLVLQFLDPIYMVVHIQLTWILPLTLKHYTNLFIY
ncbi:hypothetical protein EGR_05534 [Echinococcus granulosus]|uniref:Uncharacterized protein n=1 Tax=Echinococcus granulosus TaxID=6210 RepID=W6UE09_ECHGR|nr:hypothetical protein EGR_05534 [Echinococcus granulosus]EUB59635.1 hypothetical protein EGR_05534 [Echinococcus granulosus]